MHYDCAIIGAGAAGMAAALAAAEGGLEKIVILERGEDMGGILRQCIHDGFGTLYLGQSLTGPEYAGYFKDRLAAAPVSIKTKASVLSVSTQDRPFVVHYLSETEGPAHLTADTVILAMGCRERTLGQLRIPGSRPSGIYTAGTAQYMMNIQNLLPGRSTVILGSGDIGLMMARRLSLEGVEVRLVLGEKASGLARNHIQCIRDFNIPIRFGYTVVSVHGFKRLKGVRIAPVGQDGRPVLKEKTYIPCDTLLISAGLIPETDILDSDVIPLNPACGIAASETGETSVPGLFAYGNVTAVYDLVDKVTMAGKLAGEEAAAFITGKTAEAPQKLPKAYREKEPTCEVLDGLEDHERLCILCPKGCVLSFDAATNPPEISGFKCRRGLDYGLEEWTDPKRILSTTVKTTSGALVPVKSSAPIPKASLMEAMKKIRKIKLCPPVKAGSIVYENLLHTGADLIATGEINETKTPTA